MYTNASYLSHWIEGKSAAFLDTSGQSRFFLVKIFQQNQSTDCPNIIMFDGFDPMNIMAKPAFLVGHILFGWLKPNFWRVKPPCLQRQRPFLLLKTFPSVPFCFINIVTLPLSSGWNCSWLA